MMGDVCPLRLVYMQPGERHTTQHIEHKYPCHARKCKQQDLAQALSGKANQEADVQYKQVKAIASISNADELFVVHDNDCIEVLHDGSGRFVDP